MHGVWMQVDDGKLFIVHRTGYIAFTPEEWHAAKETGDSLLGLPAEPARVTVRGQVEGS